MVSRRQLLKMISSLPLVPAIGAVTPSIAGTAGRPQALVIGANRYRSLEPLSRACADAEAIARRLEQIGYAVTTAFDPDQAQFRAVLGHYIQVLGPDTPAFLYFAGHAVQVQNANLLLPVDAVTSSAAEMADSAIVMHDELRRIAGKRPPQAIVVLDACRNDPFRSQIPSVSTGIASVNALGAFYIVYSAGTGETALDRLGDNDSDPNGVFTRVLLPQLRPEVSVHEIMQRTKAGVRRLAASVGHSQHPAIYDQAAEGLTLLGDSVAAVPDHPPIAVPTDPQSRFLAIGMQRTRYRGTIFNLNGAAGDARLIGSTLRASGIEGSVLIDPDEQQMQSAISELARSDATTVILYFAGNGMFSGGDGVLLSSNEFVSVDRGIERSPRIGEILRELRDDTRNRRAVFLMDSCLATDESEESEGRGGYLRDLIADPSSVAFYCPAALLSAADIGSIAYDLTPDRRHGPFATALHNALSRPGKTIAEIAEQVRVEVAQITSQEVQPPSPQGGSGMFHRKSFTLSRTQRVRAARNSILPEVQRTAFWAAPGMEGIILSRPLPE